MMMIKKEKEFKNFVHKTISQWNQSFSEVVICDFILGKDFHPIVISSFIISAIFFRKTLNKKKR